MEAYLPDLRMNLKPPEVLINIDNKNKTRKRKLALLMLVVSQVVMVLIRPVKVAKIPSINGKLEIQSNSGTSYYTSTLKHEQLDYYGGEEAEFDTLISAYPFVAQGDNP